MHYDDRLAGHDSTDEMIDAAENIAREMAREHYEACYDRGLCGMCADDTPISGQWGPWMGKMRQYDGLIEAVEQRLRDRGDDPHWVAGHLSGVYLEAFAEAAVDPDDCPVCTRVIVGEGDECGHERYEGPGSCPARD